MRRLPALLLTSAIVLLNNATAATLTLCFEDAPQPPWTMPDGSGLNFDLLKRVEKLTGETFKYNARPWTRCMEETRAGLADGMIGAADSPQRRQFSTPPLRDDGTPDPTKAMYEGNVNVFIRVGSHASWDGNAFQNPTRYVIAQRGYFVVELLRLRGQTVKEAVKSTEEGLRMLAAGSADVAVLTGENPAAMIEADPRFRGKIKLAPHPFVTFSYYLMFNHKIYAAKPKRIEAIWNAIRDVRASTDYRTLESQASRPASKN